MFRIRDKETNKIRPDILMNSKGQLFHLYEWDNDRLNTWGTELRELNRDKFIIERDTGSLDKNGVEIFEGDTIEVYRLNLMIEAVDGWYTSIEQGKVFYSDFRGQFLVEFPGYDDVEDLMPSHRNRVIKDE